MIDKFSACWYKVLLVNARWENVRPSQVSRIKFGVYKRRISCNRTEQLEKRSISCNRNEQLTAAGETLFHNFFKDID